MGVLGTLGVVAVVVEVEVGLFGLPEVLVSASASLAASPNCLESSQTNMCKFFIDVKKHEKREEVNSKENDSRARNM